MGRGRWGEGGGEGKVEMGEKREDVEEEGWGMGRREEGEDGREEWVKEE